MKKPNSNEYVPYFKKYIDLVEDGNFFELFEENTNQIIQFFSTIPESKHNYKYGPDKWTIKQVLMHINDTERVFAYRALIGGRQDEKTKYNYMDENWYADHINVDHIDMSKLVEEFSAIRLSSKFLFESLNEVQSSFIAHGTDAWFSPQAIGYAMIGHAKHHINVIEDRYL